MNYLSNLNLEQLKAVTSNGSLAVIAGPGTGKTKTLTSRIAYLLDIGINPSDITALTFTNKAAQEMSQRVKSLLPNIQLPFIGTIHAYCFQLLRQLDSKLKIIDVQQKNHIVKSIMKDELQNYSYSDYLIKNKLLDFELLLTQTRDYLIQETLNSRLKYLLVDEFQDTNPIQYSIIKHFIKGENIFVIGDPNQAIYGFRGATPTIFSDLMTDFPTLKQVFLKNNYRSAASIISFGSSLLDSDSAQKATNTELGKIYLVKAYDEYSEAKWIVKKIADMLGGTHLNNYSQIEDKPVSFADFAILYRNKRLSQQIEKELNQSGIPYQHIGSESFLSHPIVLFISQCLAYVSQRDETLLDVPSLDFKPAKVQVFLETIDRNTTELPNFIEQIISHFQIEKLARTSQTAQKAIQTFRQLAASFEPLSNSLERFSSYLADIQKNDFYDQKADKVTLMTMHKSKGLEFNCVFILGFEEYFIPSIKKGDSIDQIDEEKRLLYVAITRAKRDLYLTHTLRRFKTKSSVSRFEKLFNRNDFSLIEDDEIKKQIKRIAKYKAKKAQQSLF